MPENAKNGVSEFIRASGVEAIVDDLRKEKINERIFSDIIDEDGHQYVNIVQEGGGTLGIALVGYTYVLESMGIRFLGLAGTSAGAINTLLLAAFTSVKGSCKSFRILEELLTKDFFDFVDGSGVARWLIKNTVSRAGFFFISDLTCEVYCAGSDCPCFG